MKSVLQSFWLLTVAFGDLIVVILASVMPALGVVSNLIFAMQWNPQNSHSSLSLPNTKLLPLISTLFTRLPNLTRLVRRIKRKQIKQWHNVLTGDETGHASQLTSTVQFPTEFIKDGPLYGVYVCQTSSNSSVSSFTPRTSRVWTVKVLWEGAFSFSSSSECLDCLWTICRCRGKLFQGPER